MKGFLKLDNDIKNWKKYKKIQHLSEICKIVIDQGIDVGFNLNEINYITDTLGWKEVEKTINIVKSKRKFYTNEFQFYNTDEKKTISVYSSYKHFILEGFEFKSDLGTCTVNFSNNLRHITKTFNWVKDSFDFKAYYRDLNMFFVFGTKFYGSNTGYIQDYNELIN